MKKLGKMLPLFLLVCMLTFAAGCGSDKNNKNQDDMAGNSTTESLPQSTSQAGENDTLAGTEAFDGTETGDGSLNNSVTDPNAGNMTGGNDDMTDAAPGSTGNGNTMDGTGTAGGAESSTVESTVSGTDNGTADTARNHTGTAGRTAGNAVDDIGNTVGNVIDDAGNAVSNAADDIGNGVKDITDTKR